MARNGSAARNAKTAWVVANKVAKSMGGGDGKKLATQVARHNSAGRTTRRK